MNLFLLTIAPILTFILLTFIDRSTNIPTDFTWYKIATAITAGISIISLLIISRKLDEVFEASYVKHERKLPSRLGFWDAFLYKFNPSKKNQSLLSEIRVEYRLLKVLTEFGWDTVIAGTNNFSDSNVVGRGKSGATTIYKAVFPPNEELVAVKKFNSQYSEQGLEDFVNEILLLPKLDHPNIIKLIGYCIHKKEKVLVYELMPITGSLDSLLYGIYKDRLKLFYLRQWSVRFKIVMGIAQGLAYLHEEGVIHGDLKLSNILLDLKMNPKISGFSSRTTTFVGNMSPESDAKMKSDVYKFGVIVLVMVTGRRITMDSDISIRSFVDYAWNVWKKHGSFALVDKSIFGTFKASEVARCVSVGILCTLQDDENDRPPMSSVIKALQGENDSTSSTSDTEDDDDDDDDDLQST